MHHRFQGIHSRRMARGWSRSYPCCGSWTNVVRKCLVRLVTLAAYVLYIWPSLFMHTITTFVAVFLYDSLRVCALIEQCDLYMSRASPQPHEPAYGWFNSAPQTEMSGIEWWHIQSDTPNKPPFNDSTPVVHYFRLWAMHFTGGMKLSIPDWTVETIHQTCRPPVYHAPARDAFKHH